MSGLSKADARAKLVDSAIHKRGWMEAKRRRFCSNVFSALSIPVQPVAASRTFGRNK